MAAKDAEITELTRKLSAVPSRLISGGDITGEGRTSLPATVSSGVSVARRGKAPPIDSFSGDDGAIRFEDWLPSLERGASWNAWTDEEKLLQLAGHLRGRALQEWNLIPAGDRSTFDSAVSALRSRVEPGNRVLAGQDFRHARQEGSESVSEYIRRLEKLFQAAYGRDGLSVETRQTLLYSQLQEGLVYDLIKSPAVSGADSYSQLCIAVRHEEKRLSELARRQQYLKDANRKGENEGRPQKMTDDMMSGKHAESRCCYICGSTDHLAWQCRKRSVGMTRRPGLNSEAGTRVIKSKENP